MHNEEKSAEVPVVAINFAERKAALDFRFKTLREEKEKMLAIIEGAKMEIEKIDLEMNRTQGAHAEIVRLETEYEEKNKKDKSPESVGAAPEVPETLSAHEPQGSK